MKLSHTIRKSIFLTTFLSLIFAFSISFFSQYNFFFKNSKQLEFEFVEQKKKEVKNEVLMLYGLIKYKEELLYKTLEERLKNRVNQAYLLAHEIYNKNKNIKSKDEIKLLIAKALLEFEFQDKNEYFFINSNSGEAILFNKEIKLDENLNLLDLKDKNGKSIVQNQIKIVKESKEGFVTNSFMKPNGESKEYKKLTYIKLFEPFDWHIGTGEYLDALREKNKSEFLDWISSLKYENSQYTFVNTTDGYSLIFEGKKLQDPKKHPFPEHFRKQLEVSKKQDGGFYEYKFKKPNGSEEFDKISYVKEYDAYGWIIGSGVYLDEVQNDIHKKELFFKENIYRQLFLLLVIFIIIVMVAYIISIKISKYIDINIENLISSFSKASFENSIMDTSRLTYSEFIVLADSLNYTLKNTILAEEKLQEYIKIVNQNVITSTTDKNGVIVDVSEAFCEISGYTKEEIIGRTHNIVRHPEVPMEFYKNMWDTLLSKKEWRGEIRNLNKKGEEYWVFASITPIIKYDEIEGFTAIRTNITNKKHIEKLSITDELTTLYNRRYFNLKFEEETSRAKRDKNTLCLILLDIDYFKQYNDTYGHQKGDYVLSEVAKVLKNKTNRASDFAFRVGGEEFVIIATIEEDKILQYAASIKDEIENLKIEHIANKVSKYITASFGVVSIKETNTLTCHELYKKVDDNLYKAKEIGRNSIFFE